MSEHSPLPYVTPLEFDFVGERDTESGGLVNLYEVRDAGGDVLCEAITFYQAIKLTKAVNSHADLVAALENVRKQLHIVRNWHAIVVIDAALAKAKETP